MLAMPEGAAHTGLVSARAGFQFHLAGPFLVVRDGSPMPGAELGSRKGRTLLKLLLIERGHVVPTERVVEVLWGEKPPPRAPRLVATLVSRLRSILGSGAIVGGPDGYCLTTSDRLAVDIDLAERLVQESDARIAAEEPSLAYSAASRALETLQRGTLLEDEPYADWVTEARGAAQRLLQRARRAAWDALLALSEFPRAVAVAEAALDDDSLDEQACRALMRGLHRSGKTAAGLSRYEDFRARLAEELGVDPAPETQALHLAMLRDEALPSESREAGAGPSPRPFDPAFVGRDIEVTDLSTRWAEAAGGRPSLVLVAGESGIGKTRLVREVVELAERTGGTCLRARCHEAERSLFLQPIADALRTAVLTTSPETVRELAGQWAGTLAELVPEIGLVLRPLAYERASPEFEKRRAFQAVASILRELAKRGPLLVFLDDLQNAGSSTLELLHFVAQRSTGSRLMVLATLRVEEGQEALAQLGSAAVTIDLGPLADGAVAELARAAGAEELTQAILAMTRGHTLSVVESLRAIAEGVHPEAGSVPESLVSAVESRVGRAGTEVEELLRVGAVLGSSFDPDVVAHMLETSVEDVFRRAESARRARLLVAAGPLFEFANDLIKEILYHTTPPPIRAARHRRAAALLEGIPEAVALHAGAIEDWTSASRAWLQAGEQAAARFAMRDAQRLLDQAIHAAGLAGEPVIEAKARIGRGRAREALALYADAFEDHTAALELARASGAADVELLSLQELGGDVHVGLGRPTRDCVPYLESALELATRLANTAAEVEVLERLTVVSVHRLDFDAGYRRATRALDLARRLHDERTLARALDSLKAASAYAGDLETLRRVIPELEPLLRRHGLLNFLQWTVFESSFLPMAGGLWTPALERISAAREVGARSGYAAYEPMFLAHAAWISRCSGDYGRGLRLARDAVDRAGDFTHPWWESFTEMVLGWMLTELHSFVEACSHLEHSLEVAQRDGAESYVVRALTHLALASQLGGEPERAAGLLERADAIFEAVRTPPGLAFLHGAHAYLAAARARLERGEVERALHLIETVRGPAERCGWLEAAGDASLLAGRCAAAGGDPVRGRALIERSLEVAGQGRLPVVAWQAHAELAALHEATHNDAEAKHHRSAAAALVENLAARIGDAKLARGFRTGVGKRLEASPP